VENVFRDFAEWYGTYGYPVLFAGVLLENAGVPVPGETAVLVAGFLARDPQAGFHIAWVILVTTLAAVLGDNLGFWLGHRWARPRLQSGKRFLFLTPQTLQVAEGYFHRYGTWTVFFARFITGLRVVGALAAGTAGMPWARFLIANAAGALAWATTMSLLGYFFGQSWELLHRWLGRGGLIILACVVLLVGLPYLLRRLHRLSPAFWDRFTRAQIWQGVLAAILEVVCIALLVRLPPPPERDQLTDPDLQVKDWVDSARQSAPFLDPVAEVGNFLGTLPVALAVTLGLVAWLWIRGRPWRESAAMLGALIGSEGLGLLLLGLLRHRGVEPGRTAVWPHGFAGLACLRAFAVFGMAAFVIARQDRTWGRVAKGLAALLTLLVGMSLVWLHQQTLTEVLLEYAAAGLVLFAGLWWLEGYGPGLLVGPESGPLPAEESPQPPPASNEQRV
jgi:membrane protein DedA with SNARE-associated domain